MDPKYRIRYTEFEAGYGQRPSGYEDFASFDAAKDYQIKYNTLHNSSMETPEWYIIAEDPVFVDADVTKD